MSTLFTFTSIFVNLFIWGNGSDLLAVTWFNLLSMLALFGTYLLGSRYLYKRSARFVMAGSVLFAAGSYISLYFYQASDRILMIVLVGLLAGATQGFYWSGNNAALYFFLKSEDFPAYFSINTILGQIVTVVVPLFSSAIVYWFAFKGAFLIMILLALGAMFFVFRLPVFAVDQPLFQGVRYKTVFSKAGTRWLFPMMVATGVLTQFQGFFSMIFIFHMTSNEIFVALLNVGYTIVLLGGLIVYRRTHVDENSWLIIGVILILAGYILAMTNHSMLMIFVVLFMQIGGLFFSASSGRQSYRLFMQGDPVWRTKLGIWFEAALALGRMIVLAGALMVHHIGDIPFFFLISLSTLAMFTMPFFQAKSVIEFEKEHGKGAYL